MNKVKSYKRKEKVQELYQKIAPEDPSKAHYSTLTPTLDYTTKIKWTNYSSLELVGFFTMNGEGE